MPNEALVMQRIIDASKRARAGEKETAMRQELGRIWAEDRALFAAVMHRAGCHASRGRTRRHRSGTGNYEVHAELPDQRAPVARS